ncbi:MAG TPA: saccharopine dehydrogenase NADP-binding domain-containing protein [Deltaproteobacteria bacterium]|nr:saccharopine dehydrogenase NADP-binding domain-containing protein [Deltaproteobacteria bacterium]HPR53938.1 saccharopine dehydrogenase NADP-binding domain-containing protein [Deltaproteobacteria bacterium]HXK46738.1 saccharopine dehydrogenase NADP-binding domain-containing protein [Deltaproteobacteria bacterium]
MKMLVIGGAGDMARDVLDVLQAEKKVKHVTICDLNLDRACSEAAGRDARFTASRVDATEHAQLMALMKQHDITLGFAGPFYSFEKPLAEAALAAGKPYVSIADDYEAYLDVITLEEGAKQKGVHILTGWGNSPGITQALARRGYNSMDDPRRINVHWAAGSNEAAGPANLTHLFNIFHGTTLQTMRSREVRVHTGGGRKVVRFPFPMGELPVYYTGHAESVSIPRNLPGLTEVTLHGGVQPAYIPLLIMLLEKTGLFSTHARRKKAADFFHKIEKIFGAGGLDKSVGRVDVYGSHKGKTAHRTYSYIGHIGLITSIPCAVAALWELGGRFGDSPGGVYSPERLLADPEPFLEELMRRGVEIFFHEEGLD